MIWFLVMPDNTKKQYNAVLTKVEVIEKDGQYVVIDISGRVHARWKDAHHANEHKAIINSLIDGAKDAFKSGK